MILEKLSGSAGLLSGLPKNIARALDYLAATDFRKMEPGKYEVDGSTVYALVQSYTTKPAAEGRWEAHEKYIDIQYVVEGTERMGCTLKDSLIPGDPYDQSRDIAFFTGEGDFFTVPAGSFALFTPRDAHMPGLVAVSPGTVRKVVMKVSVQGVF